MERRGGDVTCLELGDSDDWDFVPRNLDSEVKKIKYTYEKDLKKVKNSFHYAKKLLNSKANVIEGSCYDLDKFKKNAEIGLLSAVMTHLKNPLQVLESLGNLVSETLIISDSEPFSESSLLTPLRLLSRSLPFSQFIPQPLDKENIHSWWHLSSKHVSNYLEAIGFEIASVEYCKVPLSIATRAMYIWVIVANKIK